MARQPIPASTIEIIDRKIEDAIGRIMNGNPAPGDYCVVGDLTSRRVELSEPVAFERIEKILGVELAHGVPPPLAARRG